jgi:iron complex outermembrane receptor protein
VSFGVGGRVVHAELGSDNGFIDFSPESQNVWSGRVFCQGEWGVESLDSKFVAGVQAEDTSIDDAHLQPNVRWLWHASESTSVWASIARAVRTPSLEELDIVQRDPPTDPPFFQGNNSFRSETLLAYEIGARTRISEAVSADVTAFYNDYDHLQTYEDLNATTTTYGNEAYATAIGFEAAIDADVTERLRLRAAYTFFKMDFETSPGSLLEPTIDDRDELIPANHANLRAYYDLGDKWELDSAIYYVDHLGFFDVGSYIRVDARVGWNPSPGTQFSLGITNATDPEHPEADEIEVERAVYIGFRTGF